MVTTEIESQESDLVDPTTLEGDHPDPVTLTEPEHDAQGLLRWGSPPDGVDTSG